MSATDVALTIWESRKNLKYVADDPVAVYFPLAKVAAGFSKFRGEPWRGSMPYRITAFPSMSAAPQVFVDLS
jgi:hypothetical protein